MDHKDKTKDEFQGFFNVLCGGGGLLVDYLAKD